MASGDDVHPRPARLLGAQCLRSSAEWVARLVLAGVVNHLIGGELGLKVVEEVGPVERTDVEVLGAELMLGEQRTEDEDGVIAAGPGFGVVDARQQSAPASPMRASEADSAAVDASIDLFCFNASRAASRSVSGSSARVSAPVAKAQHKTGRTSVLFMSTHRFPMHPDKKGDNWTASVTFSADMHLKNQLWKFPHHLPRDRSSGQRPRAPDCVRSTSR